MPQQSPPGGRLTEKMRSLGFNVRVKLIDDDVVIDAAHRDGRHYTARGKPHEFMRVLRDLAREVGVTERK